jgi:hypothetical protein
VGPNQLSLGMMQNHWTPERDKELRGYAAVGLSASKIAVLLQTTRGAILGRSNRRRVSLGFWTPERDEELRRHAAAGLSASEIAVLLHTTQAASVAAPESCAAKSSNRTGG